MKKKKKNALLREPQVVEAEAQLPIGTEAPEVEQPASQRFVVLNLGFRVGGLGLTGFRV